MQYLFNMKKAWLIPLTLSFSLLTLVGCSALQIAPKTEKGIVELGCKQDQGFMILYTDGNYLFPAQMPPGCRCFILLNGVEYVTTVGGVAKNCQGETK